MKQTLVAVSAMLVSGCDLVLGLDERTRAPSCPGAGIADGFDKPPACAPWGRLTEGNATAAIADGALAFTLGPNAPAQAGCTSFLATVVSPEGVTLEVDDVSPAPSAFVQLALVRDDQAMASPAVLAREGMVHVVASGEGAVASLPLDLRRLRGLRLRPAADGVVGEVSTDGDAWTVIGTLPGTPPASAYAAFLVGTTMPEASPSVTALGGLRFCAP